LAIVADSRITRETLLPSLLESAGAAALEEALLDIALEREISRAGFRFTVEDIEREREIVLQTVAEESQVDIDRAALMVDQLRRERGLGPRRYQAQLLRNAKLRALVSESITVSDEEVELAKKINFGEKVRVRIITVAGEREVAEIRSALLATSAERRSSEFAMIAIARSTDSSARRGGDLGFISPEDPSLPLSIREQLREAKSFEPTDPAVFGDGFAIALVEDRTPASQPASDDDVRRRVLLRKQRVAMDDLSNRLLAASDATVFDESLRWSWERRR
jgi:parvulin-like peptidyl-prolyl isomerase